VPFSIARAVLALTLAGLPPAGVLVPGSSLGGLRLGMTKAQVGAAWGARHGRCRDCRDETWYFTYAPFSPAGAGVAFRSGRVAAIFTLGEPRGWRTSRGLRIGDSSVKAARLYRSLGRTRCGAYDALTLSRPGAVTALYVQNARVFAFGLSRAGVPLCR
jgi:hypothetical protein